MKRLQGSKPPRWLGAVLGTTAGFTSTLAHIGGPPIMMYLLPQKLPKAIFVGTNAIFFLTINIVKLAAYTVLGLLTIGNLTVTLILIPLALLGIRVGIFLNRAVSETFFNYLLYILLLLTGLQLILGRSFVSLF